MTGVDKELTAIPTAFKVSDAASDSASRPKGRRKGVTAYGSQHLRMHPDLWIELFAKPDQTAQVPPTRPILFLVVDFRWIGRIRGLHCTVFKENLLSC